MKRANNLFEKITTDENLLAAIHAVNNGHRWTAGHRRNKTVAAVEANMEEAVRQLRETIEKGFIPHKPRTKRRWDKSAGKWRDISEPRLWPDQYVHHAMIQVLEPVMMRGMDPFACGSIKHRGVTHGMQAIKKWMKRDRTGTRWCLEMDIRHFYDSLRPSVVMDRLRRLVKDRRLLQLAERVLRDGVLIGMYPSQWFANTVLQPVDQLIRRSGDAAHYVRYMDNFTVFGRSKRGLRRVRKSVAAALHGMGLEVKDNWQIFRAADRMPTAMGYRYGRGYTLLRKRNLLRVKRQLAEVRRRDRKGRRVTHRLAQGLLSRLGQLQWCNRRNILRQHYAAGTQRRMKQVVRQWTTDQKEKWRANEDESQKRRSTIWGVFAGADSGEARAPAGAVP